MDKGLHPPLPQKGDLGIAKNYRSITLTSIAANIYNALLLNRIEPEIEKFFGKTKIAFVEIDPQHQEFWQSVEFSKVFVQKTSRLHYYL